MRIVDETMREQIMETGQAMAPRHRARRERELAAWRVFFDKQLPAEVMRQAEIDEGLRAK